MRTSLRRTLLMLCLFSTGATAPAAERADLILHHAKIVTVDDDFSIAEAIAVRGNRILRVGSEADVLALRGAGTRVVDLAGATVLPGLIDSHMHPQAAAMHEFDHRVRDMETIQDVLDYIRSRTQVVKEGEWIWVQQVFITRLREQRYPTRAELDRVAPKHPVAFQTGPDAALNSLAWQRVALTKRSKSSDLGAWNAIQPPANSTESCEAARVTSSRRRTVVGAPPKRSGPSGWWHC